MPYVGRDLQRGNYVKLDDISSSFDGSVTTFNLTLGNSAFYPGSPFAILVSLGGIIQEPESAYTINQSQITFAAAPHNVDNCFIIALGLSLGIGVPGHGTVDGDQLAKPLNYNTGDLYLDSTNNRIGVGNTSPQYRLDVTGDANVSGNLSVGGTVTYQDVTSIDSVGIITAQAGIHLGIGATAGKFDASTGISTFSSAVGIADSIFHVGNTDTSIRFPDDDVISVEASGDEKLRITSGKVGIGTANPGENIDVVSSTLSQGIRVWSKGDSSVSSFSLRTGDSGNNYIYFGDTSDHDIGQIRYYNGDNSMRFVTNTTERLRIDSSGRVSIGQTDPSWGVSTGLIVGDGASSRGITIYSNSSNVGDLAFADATSGTGRYSGLIRYSHNNNFMAFRTATDERIRIISDGKVGIGTTAPESLLSLYSEAAGAELLHFDMGDATDRRGWKFLQHDTGSQTDLHLQADANGKWFAVCNSDGTEQFEVYTNTTAADAFVRVIPRISIGSTIVHHGDTDTSIGFPADGQFAVETNGSERLRVSGTGKLLIGTNASRNTRVGGNTFSGLVQVESDDEMGYTISRFVDTGGGPRFVLQKARGTGASPAIVQEDDQVAQLLFSGWDGDTFTNVAKINVEVDGAPGDDDMPGRITFQTTADGEYQTTERLRINSTGQLELRKNQNGVTGRPENRIVFKDTDGSVAAEQPIGEISWYSTDAGMTNVNSWIRGINEATNGAGALLFGVKDAGEDEIEALRITHDGLVGIGTPVPDAKLEVYNGGIKIDRRNVGGTSNPHLNMITGANGTSRLMIYAEDGTDDNSNWVYKTNSNEEHSFVVATTEILRLRSNKVGIGQSVPTSRLQVAGDDPYALTDSGRAVEGIDITGTAGGNGNYGAAISFGAGATGRAAITAVQNATDADNVGLAIITHPTGTGANDGVEKIRIHSSGRIGIGTDTMDTSADVSITNDTSSARIYLKSADDSDCSIYFGSINDSATGAIRYDHSDDTLRLYGYNNSEKINISSSAVAVSTVLRCNSGFVSDTNVIINSDNNANNSTNDSIIFQNRGNELVRIKGTGNVGIGTNTPDARLHISSGTGNNDCVVIIESDTDNNDENSNPQIWFKQDGDINAGFVGQSSNKLVLGNSIATNGGVIFKTGTTNNSGTTDPLDGTTEKFRIAPGGKLSNCYDTTGSDAQYGQFEMMKQGSADADPNWSYLSFHRVGAIAWQQGVNTNDYVVAKTGGAARDTLETERFRVRSAGGVIVAANANDTGTIQLQDNIIGGKRIAVSQDTISDAIYMPRQGCILAITAFTTYDTYPQPGSSGLVYADMGPSRRVDVMYTVNEGASAINPVSSTGTGLQGKGSYSATITDCTDGKTTIMAGNTEGTFRIVNRTDNDYTYTITFL